MSEAKQELYTAKYVLRNAQKDAERGYAYQENLLKGIIGSSFEKITDAAAVFAAQASQASMHAHHILADLRSRRTTNGLSLEACWGMAGSVAGLQAHVQALQQQLAEASKSLEKLVQEQAKHQPKVERLDRTRDVVRKLESAIVKTAMAAKATSAVKGAAVVSVTSDQKSALAGRADGTQCGAE